MLQVPGRGQQGRTGHTDGREANHHAGHCHRLRPGCRQLLRALPLRRHHKCVNTQCCTRSACDLHGAWCVVRGASMRTSSTSTSHCSLLNWKVCACVTPNLKPLLPPHPPPSTHTHQRTHVWRTLTALPTSGDRTGYVSKESFVAAGPTWVFTDRKGISSDSATYFRAFAQ